MIANYRNLRHRDDLMQAQLQRLTLRSELDELYKRANIRRWTETEPSFEVPRVLSKPKEFETKFDIRERLVKKLQPFMINNNEVISFTEYLEDTNKLDELDDLFDQFKKDYIKGARRLTNTRMQSLFEDFIRSKKGFDLRQVLRVQDVPPTRVDIEPSEIPSRRSALSSIDFQIEEPVETDETGEMKEPTEGIAVMETGGRDDLIFIRDIPERGGITDDDIKEAAKNTGIKFNKKTTTKAGRKQSLIDKGYIAYDPTNKLFLKADETSGSGMKRGMCWKGYRRVPNTKPYSKGSCRLIGSGLVKGLNHRNISNVPSKNRREIFQAMMQTGWN